MVAPIGVLVNHMIWVYWCYFCHCSIKPQADSCLSKGNRKRVTCFNFCDVLFYSFLHNSVCGVYSAILKLCSFILTVQVEDSRATEDWKFVKYNHVNIENNTFRV